VNYYSDVWFWRASDQAAVARHLRERSHMASEPDEVPRQGLLRSAIRSLLRAAGLAERPVDSEAVVELPAREACACEDGEEFERWEPILHDGEWVLRCPECGHLDRLEWLSDEARPLVLGLARRRPLRMRKAAQA
jgi:hypothetical protein